MPALLNGVSAVSAGVPGDAVAAAVPPAVSDAVLSQDTAAYKGEASAGPGGSWPQEAVPVSGPGIPGGWQETELMSPVTDETYLNPGFGQGPWPVSERPGEALGAVPDDGIDTYAYPIASKQFTGAWERDQVHPGSDLHSQSVDAAGWQQNTPSGRTAVRRGVGQTYPGVENFWFDSAPRPTTNRVAATAQPYQGTLAEYGGIYGAGGDLAYQPPAPPSTSDVSSLPAPSGAGLNQWGAF